MHSRSFLGSFFSFLFFGQKKLFQTPLERFVLHSQELGLNTCPSLPPLPFLSLTPPFSESRPTFVAHFPFLPLLRSFVPADILPYRQVVLEFYHYCQPYRAFAWTLVRSLGFYLILVVCGVISSFKFACGGCLKIFFSFFLSTAFLRPLLRPVGPKETNEPGYKPASKRGFFLTE